MIAGGRIFDDGIRRIVVARTRVLVASGTVLVVVSGTVLVIVSGRVSVIVSRRVSVIVIGRVLIIIIGRALIVWGRVLIIIRRRRVFVIWQWGWLLFDATIISSWRLLTAKPDIVISARIFLSKVKTEQPNMRRNDEKVSSFDVRSSCPCDLGLHSARL